MFKFTRSSADTELADQLSFHKALVNTMSQDMLSIEAENAALKTMNAQLKEHIRTSDDAHTTRVE
jgi:hypothetical protein